MNCPGCGEANEAGMQFCINCGHSLSPPPAPSAAAPPPISAPVDDFQARASGQMVLVCTVCNKTDPLNGQFCVYCGGRTVPGPAPFSAPAFSGVQSQQASVPSGQYDIPRSSSEQHQIAIAPKPKASSPSPLIGIVLGLLLGGALAAGAVYFMREDIQAAAAKTQWPHEGLLVYSNAKNCDLTISDSKRKTFIFGRTSASGTLHFPSLAPGGYKLSIADKHGQAEEEFTVNQGDHNIIGYPKRLELK